MCNYNSDTLCVGKENVRESIRIEAMGWKIATTLFILTATPPPAPPPPPAQGPN